MYSPNHHRLGKKPPRHDHRTLLFAKYLKELPSIPLRADWTQKAALDWGMMANDRLGDCSCAAIGHALQLWTSNHDLELTLSDEDIIKAYEGACGYNPNDPSTDQGGIELDVLNYWRTVGVGGDRLDAFTALEVQNLDHVTAAIDLFGLSYIGLELPLTAQDQIGGVWSVVPHSPGGSPGSWGGHAVIVGEYDELGLTCITWGKLQRMTWAFWTKYCSEAYACLSKKWVDVDQLAPSGFDYATLQNDLAAL